MQFGGWQTRWLTAPHYKNQHVMKWHLVHVRGVQSSFEILLGPPEGKRTLRTPAMKQKCWGSMSWVLVHDIISGHKSYIPGCFMQLAVRAAWNWLPLHSLELITSDCILFRLEENFFQMMVYWEMLFLPVWKSVISHCHFEGVESSRTK